MGIRRNTLSFGQVGWNPRPRDESKSPVRRTSLRKAELHGVAFKSPTKMSGSGELRTLGN